jgi:dolichol-phosphate mannosyltransferase
MLEALTLARPESNTAPELLLSIVVPVRNESANVLPLITEILAAFDHEGVEIVYVDDGSTDDTAQRLLEAKTLAKGQLRILKHRRNCGQSAAVLTGVRFARGQWIATLDGDGQNDPADIPILLARALAEEQSTPGKLLMAGHRTRRKDSWGKRLSSRLANRIRAAILLDDSPDTGCGLKVFRRDAFLELPHFDHMHRFLPALFRRAGGRVISVPVNHRPRLRGQSNYGTFDRLWVGMFDIVGVFWLQRRWKCPELE